jgi:hypothetical protein
MAHRYPHVYLRTDQEHRHRPAEYCPLQRGWFQDGRRLRHVKASKAFVWPKDGREGTSWGRFKEVLKNRGPDIYLTLNADKHDYMHNRPTKAEWSRHENIDGRGISSACWIAPWTKRGMLAGRLGGQSYDFRTRKYGVPNRWTWTDAIWQPDSQRNKNCPYPEAVRDIYGRWFQDLQYLPQELGGPVRNERGRGVWGRHMGPIP